MNPIFDYINTQVIKWASRKYKHLRRRKRKTGQWLRQVARREPVLFAHWRVWKWVAG